MPLQMDVLQANDGDCLLLRYGSDKKPGLILIDGGSRGIYKSVLKRRLEQLRGSAPALKLRMVMVSHIDADHITGIVDMFREMSEAEDSGRPHPFKVGSLWHNSFEKLTRGRTAALESAAIGAAVDGTAIPAGLEPSVEAVVASVAQGNALNNYARRVTSINPETHSDLIKAPASGKKAIRIDDSLTFTILGPHQDELDSLEADWEKAKASPAANDESVAADYLNRTVPNLSSIVVLAEVRIAARTKRLLLTGDAGGDLIIKGLKSAGLLDAQGALHVDLLKVQHHGSNHSVDEDFFRRITAPAYVISGNGKHGIPHSDTLQWLSAARSGCEYDVYMTNRTGVDDLEARLDTFLAAEKRREPGHRYHFRMGDALCITVPIA